MQIQVNVNNILESTNQLISVKTYHINSKWKTYLDITSFSDSCIVSAAEQIIWSSGDFNVSETTGIPLQIHLWPKMIAVIVLNAWEIPNSLDFVSTQWSWITSAVKWLHHDLEAEWRLEFIKIFFWICCLSILIKLTLPGIWRISTSGIKCLSSENVDKIIIPIFYYSRFVLSGLQNHNKM